MSDQVWRTWVRQGNRIGWYSSNQHKRSKVPQAHILVTFTKNKDGTVDRQLGNEEPTPAELANIERYESRHTL